MNTDMYLTMFFLAIHMKNYGQCIFGDGDITKALVLSTLWTMHDITPSNTNTARKNLYETQDNSM